MSRYQMGEYDVIVIGAGHAGCEAGLACARLGKRTLMLSINLEAVAMMACNPSIGGTGKGHLVREIDALGGEMGLNIDKTFIQSRMLNTAKGPAVHSLRAQADKNQYHIEMKKTLEKEPLLQLKQGEVVDLIIERSESGAPMARGVVLRTGSTYRAKAVILATGTFLGGKVFIGDSVYESGPNGLAPSTELAEKLREYGLPMRRFKTGTPARALAQSLDYDKMLPQEGDPEVVPFSFMNDHLEAEGGQVRCWLTYTNEKTHDVIRANFHRSALFGGQIEGVGPRYCPSIEDKVMKFAEKDRHQVFIEPEGKYTSEMYIDGMSSSMPEDVQFAMYRSVPGLEHAKIVRPAYAIEYDCLAPKQLKASLEFKNIEGLFSGGQFNGSSGYEEAAAQGLIAGINAANYIRGKEPLVLLRSEAYIGVLIDDLVTKENFEPYRMMTSRAEYRLLLRQDNADIRLRKYGYDVGLISDEQMNAVLEMERQIKEEISRVKTCRVGTSSKVQEVLISQGSTPLESGATLAELIRRPELDYQKISDLDPERPALSDRVQEQVNIEIKYEGYLSRQNRQVAQFTKTEGKQIPSSIDYDQIPSLRIESRQKLKEFRPENIGQASRIAGVSPADISVLLVYLKKYKG